MIDDIKKNIEISMEKTIETLKNKINTIHTGRASTDLLQNIKIEYYGKFVLLNELSNITVENSKTIKITLFDHTLCNVVKKAIISSNLDINPIISNNIIRVVLPPLTEDRRKHLIKLVQNNIEEGKIFIRNIRRDANEKIKILLKNKNISKDDEYYAQTDIQLITNKFIEKIDNLLKNKKKDLMNF
uniref:Ribosome-recycling factor n=1 Tax=Candidatus Aschnera chinzeii TaxID=1485666 RepID=A0AAT9G3Z9_9ENTR|nr:MAG: ribosome recycling factor [Candidatus Aschnera chinzeii]